jgi:hypothetical protein
MLQCSGSSQRAVIGKKKKECDRTTGNDALRAAPPIQPPLSALLPMAVQRCAVSVQIGKGEENQRTPLISLCQ